MIRVRFAPSPTGYLHIGGARTCLFNWLYARANQGAFVLRIEDTDVERSQKEYLNEILDSLRWLGLDWDELYFQSQRFDLYRQVAKKLLDAGKAYVAEDGSGAIIFKMPPQVVQINDMIHGPIQFDTALIKDQVLIKSDQSPTYNFACVVDDADMNITHIIRGDDHISNTPKQIVLYQALGYSLPQFAHIPMILGQGGGRMSKRTGATAITEYRRMGFLAGALVNYLALLGWSPGNDQEIISLPEAVKKFNITDANKTAATFDMKKLLWFNSQYIKNAELEMLVGLVKPFVVEQLHAEEDNFDGNLFRSVLKLFQERANTLVELAEGVTPFFVNEVEFDEAARAKYLSKDLSQAFLALEKKFKGLVPFDAASTESTLRSVAVQLHMAPKELIHPLRVALSGKTVGPGMFEFIEALGKKKTLARMDAAIKIFKKQTE
jgi:glutamyl-tRNA synthetase